MYATTTSGHRTYTSANKNTKCLQQWIYWNQLVGVLVQDESTTTEEWNGLSKGDAESLCTSSEESVLNGATRPYLGTAKITLGAAYMRVSSCWGTKVSSQVSRMNDTNLYKVTKTTTTYSVRVSGQSGVGLVLE